MEEHSRANMRPKNQARGALTITCLCGLLLSGEEDGVTQDQRSNWVARQQEEASGCALCSALGRHLVWNPVSITSQLCCPGCVTEPLCSYSHL